MRVSTIAILATLGCALGIACIVLWDSRDPHSSMGGAVPGPNESTDAVSVGRPPDALASPLREEETFETAEAIPSTPNGASGGTEPVVNDPPSSDANTQTWTLPSFGPRERISASVFAEKYSATDPEGRAAARAAIEQALVNEKKTAFDARREAGLYERLPLTPGHPFKFKADGDGELPLWRVFNTPDPNESHVVVLPPQEYPEVYALRDEMFWLMGHPN